MQAPSPQQGCDPGRGYAEYIIQNARLDESQPGINTEGRNINNLRCAIDDIILMAESEKELKSLLMRVKEESVKAGLKLNITKTKMASGPITSWQIDGEKVETVANCIFLGSKITADGKESACNAGDLCSIPWLGRFLGKGNGNPCQYSFLENSMDRGSLEGSSLWGCKESDTAE